MPYFPVCYTDDPDTGNHSPDSGARCRDCILRTLLPDIAAVSPHQAALLMSSPPTGPGLASKSDIFFRPALCQRSDQAAAIHENLLPRSVPPFSQAAPAERSPCASLPKSEIPVLRPVRPVFSSPHRLPDYVQVSYHVPSVFPILRPVRSHFPPTAADCPDVLLQASAPIHRLCQVYVLPLSNHFQSISLRRRKPGSFPSEATAPSGPPQSGPPRPVSPEAGGDGTFPGRQA